MSDIKQQQGDDAQPFLLLRPGAKSKEEDLQKTHPPQYAATTNKERHCQLRGRVCCASRT